MRTVPSVSAAAEALVEFGIELEAAQTAQVGPGFSGIEEADRLIESSANAFLLGCLFTQGISAERAWAAPWHLQNRLGSIEPGFLAENPSLVRSAVQEPPMLHRFKDTIPSWIVSAARRLVGFYDGDAANIWNTAGRVPEVARRLTEFDGIGSKKAFMAIGVLTRHFGVELGNLDRAQIAYDVHVRRVFLRTGIVDTDSREAMELAAGLACPESPGRLDLPAWSIGRQVCRPSRPLCGECRLSEACLRLVHRTPAGVGERGSAAGRAEPQRVRATASRPAHRALRKTSPDGSFG